MSVSRTPTSTIPAEYADERVIAARYGIPTTTLRTQRSRQFGPPYRKVGARVLYKLSEVEKWIDSHKIEPAAKAGR